MSIKKSKKLKLHICKTVSRISIRQDEIILPCDISKPLNYNKPQ